MSLLIIVVDVLGVLVDAAEIKDVSDAEKVFEYLYICRVQIDLVVVGTDDDLYSSVVFPADLCYIFQVFKLFVPNYFQVFFVLSVSVIFLSFFW